MTENRAEAKRLGWALPHLEIPEYLAGPTLDSIGYLRVKVDVDLVPGLHTDRGFIREHRLLAYVAGWLDDSDDRHVHHRNHDRADNRFANLMVVTSQEHGEQHRTVDWERAADLYRSGLTTIEVADELGTNPGSVSRRITELGVAVAHPFTRKGFTPEDVDEAILARIPLNRIRSDLFDVSRSYLAKRARALGVPAPPGRPDPDVVQARIDAFRSKAPAA